MRPAGLTGLREGYGGPPELQRRRKTRLYDVRVITGNDCQPLILLAFQLAPEAVVPVMVVPFTRPVY